MGQSHGDDPSTRKAARFSRLSEIARLIAEAPDLDLDRLLADAIARLKQVIDFRQSTLALRDRGGQTYHLRSLLETQSDVATVDRQEIPMDKGLLGEVMTSAQMQLVTAPVSGAAVFPDEDAGEVAGGALSAVMALPLQAFGDMLGAITFGTENASGYDQDDVEVAQFFATHLALAIGNWQKTQLLQGSNAALRDMVCEREKAEAAHKQSEMRAAQAHGRLIDAIEAISEGFAFYDPDDRLVLANSTYRSMLYPGHEDIIEVGTKYEQVIRRALSLGLIEDAVGREEKWLAQRLAQHRDPQGTHLQRRTSGDWIKISERKTTDNGTVAVYSDVTELKEVETRIAELARIPEENPNPVMRINREATLIYANKASAPLLDALDLSVGDRVGKGWRARVDRGLREDQRQDFEYEVEDLVYSLLLWPVPHAGHVNLYGRDITELKRAEDRMRVLARIPEENPNPVMRINHDGALLYANKASAPLLDALDLRVGDKVGRSWKTRVSNGLRDDQRQDFEYEAEGLVYSLLLWPVPEAGHVNLYGRDITAQTRVERELRVAKEAAEAANQTKSTFLANMSHELRTPLNAIIGYSELMLEDAVDQGDDANLDDLKKIQSAGKHLLALINDVLDLSKIEAGKMEFHLESFDISQMIDDVAATVQPLAEKNNNHVDIDCPEHLGEMFCDLTKVRQVLFNLLSNACKFTESAKITLTVQRQADRTGDQLQFTVTDQGIGMSPEQVENVFDAFTQADSSTTRHYGGTGLGLSITKVFCEQLGGSIHCTSTPGEGSSFIIRLPALCRDPAAEAQLDATSPGSDTQGNTCAPLVLVIDDDPTVHDLLGRRLRRDGYRVVAATRGDDALAMARKTMPDAITLDVFMPEIDGWVVLSKLKEDPDLAEIPVIMLTFADDRSKGLSLGASEYLGKPIDPGELLNALQAHCPVSQSSRVLVVEDEAATREMVCRVLTKAGWQTDEAVNGLAALDSLSDAVPDVILLDLLMPEMDGFDFLARLRRNPDWSDIPVIVVTAKSLTKDDRMRLNGSVEMLIGKDGDEIDAILNRLNEILPASAPPSGDGA